MKLSGPKNLNWKKALIDHGEKVALGAVAVLGLAAVGMSRWAPYREKDPGVLVDQVREADAQHKASTWPEAEREKYVAKEGDDISKKAKDLLAGIDPAAYDFGRTNPGVFEPIIPQKQPIDEPKWFAVRNLMADSGYLLYEKAAAYDPTLMAEDGTGLTTGLNGAAPTPTPVGDGLDDFRPAERPTGVEGEGDFGGTGYSPPGMSGGGRGGAAGMRGGAAAGRGGAGAGRGGAAAGRGGAAAGRGGAAGGRGGAAGGRGGAAGGRGGAAGRGGMGSSSGMAGMMPDMESGYDGGYAGGLGVGTPVEGVAKRYVAVRGVFPLKQQEEELASSRSQSRTEVLGLVDFADFELERQKAVAGGDPWSGEWRKVDVQVATDVLEDQARFDVEVVDPSLTNAVFTMPLPGRVMGNWYKTGSHPALTQYDQSEEFQKRQAKLQEMIAGYAAELERQNKETPQYGGFANLQFDAGQVGRAMMEDADYMNSAGATLGQPGAGGTALTKDDIKALITASGTYVLFRYFDFDVQPGNAYRYRVRLKAMNPNLGLPIDQVARPDVAEGQYRWTEWSEPTPAVIVPRDTRHFLAAVETGGARASDRARFDTFQWSTETGTTVNASLPVEPGQFIAGAQATEVLDIAAQTFEPRDFTFTSGDMLVDIDRAGGSIARARPELNLQNRNFEIPSQVLVVNDSGQLEVQDEFSDAAEATAYEKQQAAIAELYQYLKEAAPAADETGMEEGGDYGGMMSGGAGRGGGGGANPLRRGGRNRGRNSGAGGAEGMESGEGSSGGRPSRSR